MTLNLDLIATTKSRVEAEIDTEEAQEESLELIEIGRRHGELEVLRSMAILNYQNGANKIGREPMLHELTAKQSAQINAANREKRVPSYNELWKDYWPVFKISDRGGEKSKRYLRAAWRKWENYVEAEPIGQMPCSQVSDDMAKVFIGTLPHEHDGKNKLLQMFRKLSERAIKAKHLDSCPFDGIRAKKGRATKNEIRFWHPETEYPLILKYARDDNSREYFAFCMGAGARPNEALPFRWEDVDFENNTLTFRYGLSGDDDEATKSGEPVRIPMLAEANQWLQHRVDRLHGGVRPSSGYVFTKSTGEPYKGVNQNFGLNKTLDAAGITDRKGKLRYGFRRGYGMSLANGFFGEHWSRPEAEVMLRHKNQKRKAIDHYYSIMNTPLAEKAARSKPMTNPADFSDFLKDLSPKADGAIVVDMGSTFSNEGDLGGSERANPSESFLKRKGTTRHGSPLLEAR